MVLPFVLTKLTKHAVFIKAIHVADTAFGIASLCVIPALFTIGGYWYTQKPTLNNLDRRAISALDVPAGSTARLADPFHLTADTTVAVYHVSLIDAQGEAAYVYPDVMVKDPQHMDLGSQSVSIPASLRPGVYSLDVDVQYKLNPIKTASVRVQLARIQVTQSNAPPYSDASETHATQSLENPR